MKIAFVGVGNIGFPMASNLVAAGHDLTIHDLARAKAEPLLAKGARWAGSAAEAARGAEIVMTSLPGPPQVRAVMESGLLAAMESGAIWLEMSTTDIAQLRRQANEAAARGVATLECPVTGGVRNAYKGKISIFCGGERATFERARPVLAGTSEKQFYLGPLGAAMTTKLVTNMLCFIHEMALAEGLMIGKRAGLDLREFVEAIQSSYGASFVAGTDSAKIFDGTYDTTFALSHALKDMRLTTELGQKSGVPLALARFVQGHMERAEARFGGGADCLAVVQMLEADSGIALRA